MKNLFFAGLIALFPFTIISCITSLQHLASYQNIIIDNRLVGSWEHGGKHILIQEFRNSRYKEIFKEARMEKTPFSIEDSIFTLKHYIISYHEKNLDYAWVAAIVRVGKLTFTSLVPEACTDGNEDISQKGGGFQDAHSFAKLEWNNDNSFQLRFLDGDYIKEIVLTGKARIQHEYDPLFGTFVITAPAQELEQFLEKYGNDERLFKGGNTINLVRKK